MKTDIVDRQRKAENKNNSSVFYTTLFEKCLLILSIRNMIISYAYLNWVIGEILLTLDHRSFDFVTSCILLYRFNGWLTNNSAVGICRMSPSNFIFSCIMKSRDFLNLVHGDDPTNISRISTGRLIFGQSGDGAKLFVTRGLSTHQQ